VLGPSSFSAVGTPPDDARFAERHLKRAKAAADMTLSEEVRLARPLAVQTTDKGVLQVQLIHSLKSRRDSEEGFTLIELMVVVLIIAILIAIAIPTFLGARQRAQNRAAQSDLRNGLTAEKTFYTDKEAYTAASASMIAIEPSLEWTTTTAKDYIDVKVANVTAPSTVTASIVCLHRKSNSGKEYAIADVAVDGTTAKAGTYFQEGDCSSVGNDFAGGGAWSTDGW
jgi:type IV pilus assembly protein PilA